MLLMIAESKTPIKVCEVVAMKNLKNCMNWNKIKQKNYRQIMDEFEKNLRGTWNDTDMAIKKQKGHVIWSKRGNR